MGRPRLVLAVAALLVLVLAACGDADDSDALPTTTTSEAPPVDTEALAQAALDKARATAQRADGGPRTVEDFFGYTEEEALDSLRRCGVPPKSDPYGPYPSPGGQYAEDPFPQPANDFPITVLGSPERGDRGTVVRLDIVAGRPQALIVVLTAFFDGEHHGLREAKFADVAGHATFDLTIPDDVPLGQARFVVSASHDEQSALGWFDYVVTGPGCP